MSYPNLRAKLANELADSFAEYIFERHLDHLTEMASELLLQYDIEPDSDIGYEELSELVSSIQVRAVV